MHLRRLRQRCFNDLYDAMATTPQRRKINKKEMGASELTGWRSGKYPKWKWILDNWSFGSDYTRFVYDFASTTYIVGKPPFWFYRYGNGITSTYPIASRSFSTCAFIDKFNHYPPCHPRLLAIRSRALDVKKYPLRRTGVRIRRRQRKFQVSCFFRLETLLTTRSSYQRRDY
jgi:hypothetical protein